MKSNILICYEYFYPGYRAGGPIQSLSNLISALGCKYDMYVLTSAFDLKATMPYREVITNKWNKVYLPGSNLPVNVYYADSSSFSGRSFKCIINSLRPDTIYLNGIFSYLFFQVPVLAMSNLKSNYNIVICPRGMLKKGALEGKAFKKKIYLLFLKRFELLKQVSWHATNQDEAREISIHFPDHHRIIIAPNIPKVPFKQIEPKEKQPQQLQLVHLALINEHKNLQLLLQVLKKSQNPNITLDIYGPVINQKYWNECQKLINEMPEKVAYKGEVHPADVQPLLTQYHALILLTKGENFGHALYESFSVGRPVITSHFTPWNSLLPNKAGVNVDVNNIEDCLQKINEFAQLQQEQFDGFCEGAYALACQYYNNLDSESKYAELFQSTSLSQI